MQPLEAHFTPLRLGEVLPKGWLLAEVRKSLAGSIGHLDSLVPKLTAEDDIYGTNRLTRHVAAKDVGALSDGGAADIQFLWWNSETQSNWRDAYIRSAVLADDAAHLEQVRAYVAHILRTQDAEGYLGIYDSDMRYRFDKENGELWSKTTLLRGLLAWYEYLNDPAILTAIERAVQDVMTHYPLDASHPFASTNPDVGGTSHGLMFTDVLETLYTLTHKEQYRDYALFLYRDFSAQTLNEDAQYAKLIDDSYQLRGHGVHTYEHLRAVAAAYYASGNPALKNALDKFLAKIATRITPSGGPIGDEWIAARNADATATGYEYCSLQELLHGYTDLLEKTGDATFADRAEHLFLNAAQGARNPHDYNIAYLKTDNSYAMSGGLNGDSTNARQTRYKYSPVHQEVAVCCVPNAGRITAYYIQRMWLRDGDGLVAALLGPCVVETQIGGQKVSITENTNYPALNSFSFDLRLERAAAFTIKIRRPEWAKHVECSMSYREENGFLVFQHTFKPYNKIVLTFEAEMTAKTFGNTGERYFQYGAQVLARSIAATETAGRQYPPAGHSYSTAGKALHDVAYRPAAHPVDVYEYKSKALPRPELGSLPRTYTLELYNPRTQRNETVRLEPMGQTILRQVTFK